VAATSTGSDHAAACAPPAHAKTSAAARRRDSLDRMSFATARVAGELLECAA
jgi:hypothetical protein